ncbi:MAG TPA: S1 family peptidase [Xanthomonadales bacterium]|nr:S1 family peptidase [Xanthomonadales bacterium]
MHHSFSRGRRVLLKLSPLALLLSMAASAQIAPTARDAMKRDLGMTDDQVSQYLEIEQLAGTHGQLLAKSQGTDFAGSWIERNAKGEYTFVVATTSKEPQKTPSGVATRQAKHSLAQLEAAKAQLDNMRDSAPEGVYGWGVDVRSNSVSIDVAPGAQREAIDFVAASGADPGTIRFSPMASRPVPLATFYGGSEYLSYSGGSYYYCSVGFAVTKTGAQGFATAGHCGNQGDTVHTLVNRRTVSAAIGSFQGSFYPNQGDGAWVSLGASHTLVAAVDGYNQADVPVRGAIVAGIGSAVCRSGRTTGFKCGTIEAYDNTVNYPDVSVSGLTRVKVCAEGGDSGGSFITGAGQAQGVLSGGNYSCKGNQASLATSYFQPIGEILQSYGLTLKTQ